jgi:hypothetical protein
MTYVSVEDMEFNMEVIHIVDGPIPLCDYIGSAPNHRVTTLDHADSSTCARCREKAGLGVLPSHWLERIDSIWAFVADDEGGEGVQAAPMRDGSWVPLIAADESRLRSMKEYVQKLATQFGTPIRLIKFTMREDVEVIEP